MPCRIRDLLLKKEFKNPQIILAGEEELRDLTGFSQSQIHSCFSSV